MTQIIVYTHTKNTSQKTLTTNKINPTKIVAKPNTHYELIDQNTDIAPKKIYTTRQNNDLFVSFDDTDTVDLIIEEYFDTNAQLIGFGESGAYYQYVGNDILTHNLANQPIVIQELGASPSYSPWWASAGGVELNTVLLGAIGAATVVGAMHKGGNNTQPQTSPDHNLPVNNTPPIGTPTTAQNTAPTSTGATNSSPNTATPNPKPATTPNTAKPSDPAATNKTETKPVEPKPTEPTKPAVEPTKPTAEPVKPVENTKPTTETKPVEPKPTETVKPVVPPKTETQPPKTEPTKPAVETTKPTAETKPVEPKPTEPKPTEPKPTEPKPAVETTKPVEPKPTETVKPVVPPKTENTKPTTETKPVEPKPTETVKPVVPPKTETQPPKTEPTKPAVEPKPTAEPKPTETVKPVVPPKTETQPPKTEPTKPAVETTKPTTETKPVEPKPTETVKPVVPPKTETQPPKTEPTKPAVEPKPTAEPKPTETKPVVPPKTEPTKPTAEPVKPVENTKPTAETKPVEPKPTETKPVVPPKTEPIENTKPITPEPPPKPKVTTSLSIDDIANDGVINVSESSHDIIIQGRATGDDVVKGQTVHLLIGDTTHSTALDDNLNFALKLPAQTLKNSQQITATLDNTTAKDTKNYTFTDNALASITIDKVVNDSTVNLPKSVRLSGQVDLPSQFVSAGNKAQIKGVTLTIDNKTYHAGVNQDDLTFFVDIERSQLANGQKIDYTVQANDTMLTLAKYDTPYQFPNQSIYGKFHKDKAFDYYAKEHATPVLAVKNLSIDNQALHDNTVQLTDTNNQTLITGSVSGVAKDNDKIAIEIGGKTFDTFVKDGQFSLKLDNTVNADTIKASLTTDHNGKTIHVSDTAHFYTNTKNNDNMVFINGKVDYDKLPHFLKVLEIEQAGEINHRPVNRFITQLPYGEQKTPVEIGYYFYGKADYDKLLAEHANNPRRLASIKRNSNQEIDFTDANKLAVKNALDAISKYTQLTFKQVDAPLPNGITYKLQRMNVANSEGEASENAVMLNKNLFGDTVADKSLYTLNGTRTVIHETLHILGMGHTHEGDHTLTADIDTKGVSVMSYDGTDFIAQKDLRVYDMAYLHYRFGVNKQARKDDDVYRFKNFDYNKIDGDVYIWDGGGVDTFDASQEKQGVYVNLTPGSRIYNDKTLQPTKDTAGHVLVEGNHHIFTGDANSYFKDLLKNNQNAFHNKNIDLPDFVTGQAFIGYNTQLENLIGSNHDDILIGNHADNHIYGGAGDDKISGGAGDDYLNGGTGKDTLSGGVGNDTYIIDNRQDIIIENSQDGTDTAYISVNDYTLGHYVENVYLLDDVKTLTANNSDNIVYLNSHANSVTGGGGSDKFVFNTLNGNVDVITDFGADDKLILPKDLLQDGLDNLQTLFNHHIIYDTTTHLVSFDKDGKDTGLDAVVFARLDNFNQPLTIDNIAII